MPNPPQRDDVLRTFGQHLRSLREQAGLSQADLAHRAELHPTYVSGMENGRRNASLMSLYAVATALGLKPSELLPPLTDSGDR